MCRKVEFNAIEHLFCANIKRLLIELQRFIFSVLVKIYPCMLHGIYVFILFKWQFYQLIMDARMNEENIAFKGFRMLCVYLYCSDENIIVFNIPFSNVYPVLPLAICTENACDMSICLAGRYNINKYP